MPNDDLALCLWAHDVWDTISRNPLKIETWVLWTTNRKWPIGIRMVTYKVMTPIYLGPIISTTVGDTDLELLEHL